MDKITEKQTIRYKNSSCTTQEKELLEGFIKYREEKLIEKVCEWLKKNANDYLEWYDWEECRINTDELLYNFKKAMEKKDLLSKDNQPYVDLGLSVKWATCNVGATNSEDYGDYFAWGETDTKNEYTDKNCKTYGKSLSDISGDASYDVARSKWGGNWRMPTKSEWDELRKKCQWEWTGINGVKGYNVIGANGNNIFLPASGWRNGSSLHYVGVYSNYWSSTPDKDDYNGAYGLYFDRKSQDGYCYIRYYGRSVRPVKD